MDDLGLLLVDDEEDFRRTIAKRLKKRGIFPQEAGNGEDCLAVLERHPVDVVVLDVKMPGMNGIEVLRRIKETYPGTEVILLTGYATTQDGVDGIKSGAYDYLTKPVELDHLIGKIHQAYDKITREREKKKEAEFRAKMEQQMIATERLASLGTLAAGVAHEINNPLAIIQESVGWMQLLLQKEESRNMPRREDFEKALGKIKNGVERTKRITHQLLGFVRKTDSPCAETNLKGLVQEAVDLVSMDAGNRRIAILSEGDPKEETLFSDPYQLRQVLINLLNNAIHATRDDGKIDIVLEGRINQIALTVRDNGQGVPKENLEKIFEPFFSTKAPGEGTGLGLFVTRGIVEKLGGRIEVDSQLGRGASFRLILPRVRELKECSTEEEREKWPNWIKDHRPSEE